MSKELVTIGNKNSLLTLGPDLGMHSHNKEIMRQKVCQGGHWCGNNPSDKMIKPRFQNILKSSEKQVKVLTVGHQLSVFRPLRKMAMGMVFAALAFGAATLVEVNVVVRMSSNHSDCILLQKSTHTRQNPYCSCFQENLNVYSSDV